METYEFHQTPKALAAELMKSVPLTSGDVVYEPFRGEGAFYDAIPTGCERQWTELAEGKDFRDHEGEYDWIVTNPPFRVEGWEKTPKSGNAFFPLLDYFTDRARKGVAFLGNHWCFQSLFVPKRLLHIQSKGWFIQKVVSCNVKKWGGRYFLIVFTKQPNAVFGTIEGTW